MRDEAVTDDEAGKVAGRGRIGDRSPSLAAVQAIAVFRGVEPTEMDDIL